MTDEQEARSPAGCGIFLSCNPFEFLYFVPHGIFQFGPRDILLLAFFSGPRVHCFRVDGKPTMAGLETR
jgi:hypothetical protein